MERQLLQFRQKYQLVGQFLLRVGQSSCLGVFINIPNIILISEARQRYSLKSSEHALTCRSVVLPEQRDRILVA